MNYSQEQFEIYFTPDQMESLADSICRYREYDCNFNIVSGMVLDKLTTKNIRKKHIHLNISQIEFLLFLREYITEALWHKINFRYQRHIQMVEKHKTITL